MFVSDLDKVTNARLVKQNLLRLNAIGSTFRFGPFACRDLRFEINWSTPVVAGVFLNRTAHILRCCRRRRTEKRGRLPTGDPRRAVGWPATRAGREAARPPCHGHLRGPQQSLAAGKRWPSIFFLQFRQNAV